MSPSTRNRRSAVSASTSPSGEASLPHSELLARLLNSTTGISAVLGNVRLAMIGLKIGTKVLRNTGRIARRHPLSAGLMALGLLWAYDYSKRSSRQSHRPAQPVARARAKASKH